MTAAHQDILRRHLSAHSEWSGESALLPALFSWLARTGRLTARTLVAPELPWLGRRVDLALLAGRGTTTAFELKIGRLQRVLEQAAYNRTSFHRSWVVTGNQPRADGLHVARSLGVGVIVIQHEVVRVLLMPGHHDLHPVTVSRLRSAIRARGEAGR